MIDIAGNMAAPGMVWIEEFGMHMQADAVEAVRIPMTLGKVFDVKPKSFHDERKKPND